MNFNVDPAQLGSEQLLELIRQLLADNARLRAENEELKRKNGCAAAAYAKNNGKKNPKRSGRKAGEGTFRHRQAPAEEEYTSPIQDLPVNETVCPACGGELVGIGSEVVTNSDLAVVPKPEVKAYRVDIRSCRQCRRKVRGRHPEVAVDQLGATAHRLGPRAQAAAAVLHYGEGIAQRKIPRLLKSLSGLSVTQGALTQSALRLGTGQGLVGRKYEDLRGQIKLQPACNTDDTGWRVGGESAQMMVFETPAVVVYQIRRQHRNEEVREVIGDNYAGILCTDRGRSYEAKELREVKQQKCLAHIQRSISNILESKSGPARRFGQTLKAQLKEAIGLSQTWHQTKGALPDYQQRVRLLDLDITWQLRPRVLKDPDNQRLLNEIGRHHDGQNLLRFLYSPATVAPTNNAAERALRPAVIARKVSHCSKNELGAATYSAFKSVIGTLKKSGGDVLEQLTQLIAADQSQQPAPTNTS